MLHIQGRDGHTLPVDNLGGDTNDGSALRDILQNKRTGANLGAIANCNIAQQGGAGAHQDAITQLGMTLAMLLARSAQGNVMQHGNVAADDGGLADHDAGGMIEKGTRADLSGGMNIDLQLLGDLTLQVIGQGNAALVPQLVGDAIGLQGMEALEVQEGVNEPGTGGISLHDGEQVMADTLTKVDIIGDGVLHKPHQHSRRHDRRGELIGEMKGEGVVERAVIKNGGEKKRGEQGFRLGGIAGLGLHGGPEFILGLDALGGESVA